MNSKGTVGWYERRGCSSVTAYLLKEQGYNVIGVTMQIWPADQEDEKVGVVSLSAVNDARRVRIN